jgi:23S rRNA (uracil1939-C5)-methyltransferase
MLLPPIAGPEWGYRYRARLSVRDVPKKGGILVGFHERKSSYVADMRQCHVLPPKVSGLLPKLRTLIESLSIRSRLPQIELAVGERLTPRSVSESEPTSTKNADDADRREHSSARLVHALVLRILEPLTIADEAKLVAFADLHDVEFWLQPGGPETVMPFFPPRSTLAYTLPEFDVAMPFAPTDFTQVNAAVNRMLVRRALQWLDPKPGERVADFFCGLGNFTLPIARRGAHAIGVEGNQSLVARAKTNAIRNGLDASTSFVCANLFAATADWLAPLLPLDRALLDPPREGAVEVVKALPHHDDERALRRVVYVSCSPGTLARDAGILVHDRGYRLLAAGVVNMFPHTAHVESIAVFD